MVFGRNIQKSFAFSRLAAQFSIILTGFSMRDIFKTFQGLEKFYYKFQDIPDFPMICIICARYS